MVSSDNTDSGFVFGVGVEGKLSETMTARLEYLNYNIDSGHGHGDDDISVIRAGVNFKLGVPR